MQSAAIISLLAGVPISNSAITAAYAVVYDRLKAAGCPNLNQIAHGAQMEFIAGKARGSVASGLHPPNQVVMGKRIAYEGQSEDQESMMIGESKVEDQESKKVVMVKDESNETSIPGFAESDKVNDLGAPKGHNDDEPKDLRGDEEIKFPVADHPENQAQSKIANEEVKTDESKIL